MSSTAEELTSQSEQLQDTMSFFKVDDRSGQSGRRVAYTSSKPVYHNEPHKVNVGHLLTGRSNQFKSNRINQGNGKTKKPVSGPGFTIDMSSKDDKLDQEFEKF